MHKVSIHIDGGYFLKRLGGVRPKLNDCAENVASALEQTVSGHLRKLNEIYKAENSYALLYRVFYYDAKPFGNAQRYPVSGKRLDYANSPEAKFRNELFEILKKKRKFALRLGKVVRETGWRLTEDAGKQLKAGTLTPENIQDQHFSFGLRQKGVDMRMGIDIASVTLKKQAQTIILVAGDSDFIPAAKLARREGIEVILDPMWRSVSADLFEHIDGLFSGLAKQTSRPRIK
jgi:uncharacterized LabA/DUF88 family protein